jgi:glycosyltransferase involved in cell wall biosynthesis
MRIGLVHFRVGETDGVSLEMEKWRKILEKNGHEVLYISGSHDYGEIYIRELDIHGENFQKLFSNSFKGFKDFKNEREFIEEVFKETKQLKKKILKAIETYKIDFLILNNILSLGISLPAAIAFTEIIKERRIKAISHNHDFHWERDYMSVPSCSFVSDCLEKYFPPKDESIKHAVINSIAKEELKKRRGIDSVVVPNVFDFNQPEWKIDEFNHDLRKKLGILPNDIVFLHATRIVERKAVEIAIRLVGEINRMRNKLIGKLYNGQVFNQNNKIIMLMPGLIESSNEYVEFLKKTAREENVEIRWCNPITKAERSHKNSEKFYSLWDMYAVSDMVTYTSVLEGWGNQFLEGIFSKKNMIVLEYPVYISDIKPLGFEVISLGNTFNQVFKDGFKYFEIPEERKKSAAEEAINILKSAEEYRKRTNKNFELGKKYLSYEVLENKIDELLHAFK